jgi:ribosomal protein L11 methyltransferase
LSQEWPGTGHHATTKSAIRLLAELKKNKKVQKKDILDVGAGSGILSVVSEKCGARKILAVDNDPHCWREAKKTFRLNKTKKCKTTEKQIGQIKSKYDVVVANIIDGVLLQIKSELWRVTKPGGWLVLSGILESHHKDFEEDFFRGQEARVVKRVHDDEWVSLLVQKK